MTATELRQLVEAESFQSFNIRLADGRHVPVQHREFLMMSPSGRTAIVYQPDDSFNIIDVLLVTDLEVKGNGGPQSNGQG
jgi:hypothetical protein